MSSLKRKYIKTLSTPLRVINSVTLQNDINNLYTMRQQK